MSDNKYTIEVLNYAVKNIHSEDIAVQKKALGVINRALCRAFAATYNDVAIWAVSKEVRDALFELLDDKTNKLVMVNAFHAVCNICVQMIDNGTNYRDTPDFPYIEPCIKFKETTYQYAGRFLTHKNKEIRYRAAEIFLHWGDNKGWDIICSQLNIDQVDGIIPLIAKTKDLLQDAESVKYDLYGSIVPKDKIITYQQALNLKETLMSIIQKQDEKYGCDDYFAEQTNLLLADIECIITETRNSHLTK